MQCSCQHDSRLARSSLRNLLVFIGAAWQNVIVRGCAADILSIALFAAPSQDAAAVAPCHSVLQPAPSVPLQGLPLNLRGSAWASTMARLELREPRSAACSSTKPARCACAVAPKAPPPHPDVAVEEHTTIYYCDCEVCLIISCDFHIVQEGKGTKAASILVGRHTTDTAKYGMQSVLETNDLNEIMNMASLCIVLCCSARMVASATGGVHGSLA